ncbi:retrovirus-related pol polyprotein from transposon TNT 1-94 [Tanacetum coccineum]
MLNKENYVPWSSRLLRYAKSRPNGKLIYNSIMNGPYVRRIILEPGDTDREVPVNETFHEQTYDKLTEKELKQVEADDQAIQTILLGLPEDIYAAVDKKKAKLFNEWEKFTSTDGELIEPYYHRFSKLMNDFKRNKHFPEKIANNLMFLNNLQPEWSRHVTIVHQTKDLHCIQQITLNYYSIGYEYGSRQTDANGWRQWNQVIQNVVQNLGVQKVRNQNGLIVVLWITNQNPNGNGNVTQLLIAQKEEAGIQLQAKEFDLMADALDLDEIDEVNANCILMANFQQASTSSTQTDKALVYDSDGSAEENGYAKLWNDWYKKCKECKYDKISYDKAYNDMQQKIKQLQAQLGDQKGKSKDTPCVPNTLDPLSQNIEIENVELEIQVSEQKDTTKGTSVNTQFCKQSILGKPPSSSGSKLYVVTPFPKSKGLPKIDETHALSKPVTSNSVPTPQESKAMRNDNLIAPGMFRINPFEPSREEKYVLNKVRANIRTNPITVSQPHVITENGVNSNLNGLSSIGVHNTAKNRRPQPRSNTKNDRVPSTSKSSCIKNKEVEVEEHPRNLLISKNKKHMSSECNNVKLDIQNDKSEVVCAMCFGDLQWENILITRVYFVEGLGHNLFSVGQFCDCTTNLYTINLHEMASASPICLMARVTSTKSWLWHQRLSHLNFETINDLARNDLVTGLPKFKYHKEHLCPSCEQGKIKRASHPPKPVLNSKQRLHLLHMDLCGLMRVESINGKRYVRVIVDDYSRYTWVYFLRLKDEAPEVIKTFLKKIQVLLQAPVIIVRTDNVTEFKNQVLKEYFDTIATACYTQNRSIIHRRFDKTPYELINGRKPDISFLHVFGALCYPKNDCEDIGKLGAKAMYDDYIGGQPSSAPRTTLAAQAPHVLQTPTTSTTIADTAPTPTNSSSQATNFPNTS